MKKKLLLIILFICILTTGCSVNYEIEIRKDLSVIEKVTATTPSSDLEAYTKYESYSEVINGMYENTDYYLNGNSIFKEISGSNYVGGIITTEFDSIDSYLQNSQALHEIFNNASFSDNGNKIDFYINDYISISDWTSTRNPIDTVNITIKSPYEIKGLKNAKCSIKQSNFICELKITQDSKVDNMNFSLNKTRNTTKSMSIYIISGIIVFILFAGIVYYKIKNASEI